MRWQWYAGGAWTPANLGASALLGWWKADAGVFSDLGVTAATNGQGVEQWNDQSGNGNHLIQATSANRPTFNTNQLNSLPAIGFDPTSAIQTLLTATLSLGGTTASVFVVAKGSTPAANARLFVFLANGQASDFNNTGSALLLFYAAATTIQALRNSVNESQGTIVDGSFQEMGSIYDGAHNTVYIGGTAQTAVADINTFGATGAFQVGAGSASGLAGGMKGSIAEIIVTNTIISAADITHIKTYFTNKWGV